MSPGKVWWGVFLRKSKGVCNLERKVRISHPRLMKKIMDNASVPANAQSLVDSSMISE